MTQKKPFAAWVFLLGRQVFMRAPQPADDGTMTAQARWTLRRWAQLAVLLGSMPLAGCAQDPSIAVLGAYFPDWLFCLVGASVATAVLHLLAKKFSRLEWLTPSAVMYPFLLLLFCLMGWLLVFSH